MKVAALERKRLQRRAELGKLAWRRTDPPFQFTRAAGDMADQDPKAKDGKG
jgi:hypothetical protein